MAIDHCPHAFLDLANVVLPKHMARLRTAMASSRRMTEFGAPGVGVKRILSRLGLDDDFPGCYVLLRDGVPFYVGISRSVVQRLRQHVAGKTHFDASLAYFIASKKTAHDMTREEAMKHEAFRPAFNDAQQFLRESHVAFVKIPNDLEMHLFETYCAMELDTAEWNTFRTH